MLAPIVALVAWTLVVWAWMYATRLPAIARVKMQLDPHAPRGEQMATLPAKVRWKADNYNHLMEMPTIFYAVALVLAVSGAATDTDVTLAWTYVGLRVVHSLWQGIVNDIKVRFVLFLSSSIVVVALTVRAAMAVW